MGRTQEKGGGSVLSHALGGAAAQGAAAAAAAAAEPPPSVPADAAVDTHGMHVEWDDLPLTNRHYAPAMWDELRDALSAARAEHRGGGSGDPSPLADEPAQEPVIPVISPTAVAAPADEQPEAEEPPEAVCSWFP